jgi:hypothetical protein
MTSNDRLEVFELPAESVMQPVVTGKSNVNVNCTMTYKLLMGQSRTSLLVGG